MEIKTDYLETHYEVVKHLVLNEDLFLDQIEDSERQSKGMGGMWCLAQEITDKYQQKYKDEEWTELEYFETLWNFIDNYKI